MTSEPVAIEFDPEAARLVRANLYAFFRQLRRSPGTAFEEGDGWIRWRSPVPHPWFNGVLCSRPARSGDEALVGDTRAYFLGHGLKSFTWWLDIGLTPDDWRRPLEAGAWQYDARTPGMVRPTQDLPPPPVIPGLDVRVVTSSADLATWSRTFVAGYELPDTLASPLEALIADLGLDAPVRNYLGYLDGRPVATANLFLAAGVAGVQFIGTRPEARGRGIGRAMTLAPLADAASMGIGVAVLQSSAAGFGVYQRLGFRQVCAADHFFWKAPPPMASAPV